MLAELALFPLAGRSVVVDELVAEQLARGARRLEALRGIPERARQREARGKFAVLGIAGNDGLRLDALLDTEQARAERRGQDHVRVRVRGRHAVLDTL